MNKRTLPEKKWKELLHNVLQGLNLTVHSLFELAAKACRDSICASKVRRAAERFEKKGSIPDFVKQYLAGFLPA